MSFVYTALPDDFGKGYCAYVQMAHLAWQSVSEAYGSRATSGIQSGSEDEGPHARNSLTPKINLPSNESQTSGTIPFVISCFEP